MTNLPAGLRPLPGDWVQIFHDGELPSAAGDLSPESCRENAFRRWNEANAMIDALKALGGRSAASALDALAVAVGAEPSAKAKKPTLPEIQVAQNHARWAARRAVQAALADGYRPQSKEHP